VTLAETGEHHLEVVEVIIEALHVAGKPRRTAVTEVVVGVDGTASGREPGPEMFVAAAVFAHSVSEQQSALRVLGQPLPAEQAIAAGAVDPVLRPAYHGKLHDF
jgi:hypothetical protein